MEIIGVIPARFHSKRLPFKLVKPLLGKPLIQWTWENARRAHSLDKLIIACDDIEIKKTAESFGASVVLTSKDHTSGTDRIAEAVRDIDVDFIINIQADEPLIHPSIIDILAEEIKSDSRLVMVTAKKRIEDQNQINAPSVVKVVTDKDGFALYFSRLPIPYKRDQGPKLDYYKHIGIYAYTKDFLYTFKNLPPSSLEQAEKLEQLRVLEAGYRIKVISTQFDSWGVDTEEDFERVESILSKRVQAGE
jgi:3-deoxy-manno-octulosonate cytidylyltransferase (CMP-KDO synthetase)